MLNFKRCIYIYMAKQQEFRGKYFLLMNFKGTCFFNSNNTGSSQTSALGQLILFFFFYGVLRWSVAVATMRRQSSRIAAFLQADARPMFCCQGLPPLHEARCGWVSLPICRQPRPPPPGSPQRQHGGGPLVQLIPPFKIP